MFNTAWILVGSVISVVVATVDVEQIDRLKYDLKFFNHALDDLQSGVSTLQIAAADGTQYTCEIPAPPQIREEPIKDEKKQPSYSEFLNHLHKSDGRCYAYRSGWWTYEYCHKKQVRQYHMNEDKSLDEFSLGTYDEEVSRQKYEAAMKEDRIVPYVSLHFTGGTPCDVGQNPQRMTEVQFVCSDDTVGQFTTVLEKATCVYEIKVHTKGICIHPALESPSIDKEQDIVCTRSTVQPVHHKRYKAGEPHVYTSGADLSKSNTRKKPSKLIVQVVEGELRVTEISLPDSDQIDKTALLLVTGEMTDEQRKDVREALVSAGSLEGVPLEYLHHAVDGFAPTDQTVDIILVDVLEHHATDTDCLEKLLKHISIKYGWLEQTPQEDGKEDQTRHDEI
ncbi:hypothetical protein SARC_00547 [Sphaeroforma arctica JP610]|uniref:MRH domain-containing protein n=1 Tax=Sphaeroforma arctica JP610 TaxID=667725 RepID=A0A0L0GEA2_9EUKA|nr:hypothetical protein SARC_00547 [Sphaeroforma arctica JP610]KNC87357.1 hypothetical protein SARC_00547 [Sphaeroforma arctica JP610]|eukprot:XP_014161259.1 hypothetical protein SARC_00547 [Sphaeroforma arctica JP610]